MTRRTLLTAAVAAVALADTGCRTCGDRTRLFRREECASPTGRLAAAPQPECCQPTAGYPVVGTPVGLPTYPSVGAPGRADELPMPSPADRIPTPGVPLAPPKSVDKALLPTPQPLTPPTASKPVGMPK